jgi:hypothetical protein
MKKALSSVNLVPVYQITRRRKIVMGRNYLQFVHTRTEGFISFLMTQWCHVIFVLYFLFLSMDLCTALVNLIRKLY